MPNYRDLSVLDRDEELRRYRGSYPDFHPKIPMMRTLDVELVRAEQVMRLLDLRDVRLGEIGLVPRDLATTFLETFRSARTQIQTLIEQLAQQPGTGAEIAAAMAEIAELEEKIKQLEAYLGRLPALEEVLLEAGKVSHYRDPGIGVVADRGGRG